MFRALGFLAVLCVAFAATATTQAAVSDGLALYSSMDAPIPGDPLYYWKTPPATTTISSERLK